jgi:sporulation protein YlmC with PRC-barrel domain
MLKKLIITTAIAGLTLGSAVAAENGTSPVAKSPDTGISTTAPASAAGGTSSASLAGPAKFVNSQRSDQFLASRFKGTDVIGADDQKIGDVSDILFDKDGKIEAYVVSVGGFLGIGSKDVALAPSAFQVVAGDKSKNESDKLRLSMSKDELKQAANFEPYKAPSSTTGMGSNTRPGGTLGGATRPTPAPAAAPPAPATAPK